MKHFFTISLCCLALSLSAQEAITYPYNPDGNADGTITVPDLQDFLGNYGSPFSPAEIMVGDTALGEWIQILYQALEDQQEVIEAMQGASDEVYINENLTLGFSESTTWTCPEGITQITIELWGGGGGGGSSSGWQYQYSGSNCYKEFYNWPGNGGYGGYGVDGGNGGYGGYNKTVLNVEPGMSYSIIVGDGGLGGDGMCPIGVNEGTDGGDGGGSSLMLNEVVLVSGEGGNGGTKGIVSCGCPNVGGGGNGATCEGYIYGVNGNNGAVINYTQLYDEPTIPSYIPQEVLTAQVNCCAQYGGAGLGGGCVLSSNQDNSYPNLVVGAKNGQDGEIGFVIIKY
jgi:hypothetical protein